MAGDARPKLAQIIAKGSPYHVESWASQPLIRDATFRTVMLELSVSQAEALTALSSWSRKPAKVRALLD